VLLSNGFWTCFIQSNSDIFWRPWANHL
jgi:hypothetical protein